MAFKGTSNLISLDQPSMISTGQDQNPGRFFVLQIGHSRGRAKRGGSKVNEAAPTGWNWLHTSQKYGENRKISLA